MRPFRIFAINLKSCHILEPLYIIALFTMDKVEDEESVTSLEHHIKSKQCQTETTRAREEFPCSTIYPRFPIRLQRSHY